MRILALTTALALTAPALAQTPQSYSDGARGEVTLPQGDLSFADAVVAQTPGSGTITASAADPASAIGPPDYTGDNNGGTFATLGCGGTLTLQFTDNALIDLPGPDLHVFEVGPDVEGTALAISQDGTTWAEVGGIAGGRSEIDIAAVADPDATYSFVRLTDDGVSCSGRFAGADIDAVAAIGTATRFTLDGAVLFDVDSADLKPAAETALADIAGDIAKAGAVTIAVVGHTDATGSTDYNQSLSQARATTVRDFLTTQPDLSGIDATARGAGEAEPVETNDTEEGRAANRRVEIIVRQE
ncbi:OmpA family protein [Yoonia sp. 208BN28-4]|uniref:OmpA family protein n=1 Tax=Yoonia sp. 208BN28-4 TaxID=3126505 RepID=UPI0030A84750